MHTLVIDVGNSSPTLGSYRDGRVAAVRHVAGGIGADPSACERAVRAAAGRRGVDGAALASVVPRTDAAWLRLVRRAAGVDLARLDATWRLPLRLDYPHPETTGADRLANVAGAVVRYGAPVLVIDIGTAVTFDAVSSDRRFFTGAIAPGPGMLMRALHDYTALLPAVGFDGRAPAIPKDTAGAMRFGVLHGYRGLLLENVRALRRLLGRRVRVVATGGYAQRLLPLDGLDAVVDPSLTLFGLGWLHAFQESHAE